VPQENQDTIRGFRSAMTPATSVMLTPRAAKLLAGRT
jgi:hypothetical protein